MHGHLDVELRIYFKICICDSPSTDSVAYIIYKIIQMWVLVYVAIYCAVVKDIQYTEWHKNHFTLYA